MRTLKLRYEGRIVINDFRDASSGIINRLPLDKKDDKAMAVVQATNIMIGHAARQLIKE